MILLRNTRHNFQIWMKWCKIKKISWWASTKYWYPYMSHHRTTIAHKTRVTFLTKIFMVVRVLLHFIATLCIIDNQVLIIEFEYTVPLTVTDPYKVKTRHTNLVIHPPLVTISCKNNLSAWANLLLWFTIFFTFSHGFPLLSDNTPLHHDANREPNSI